MTENSDIFSDDLEVYDMPSFSENTPSKLTSEKLSVHDIFLNPGSTDDVVNHFFGKLDQSQQASDDEFYGIHDEKFSGLLETTSIKTGKIDILQLFSGKNEVKSFEENFLFTEIWSGVLFLADLLDLKFADPKIRKLSDSATELPHRTVDSSSTSQSGTGISLIGGGGARPSRDWIRR